MRIIFNTFRNVFDDENVRTFVWNNKEMLERFQNEYHKKRIQFKRTCHCVPCQKRKKYKEILAYSKTSLRNIELSKQEEAKMFGEVMSYVCNKTYGFLIISVSQRFYKKEFSELNGREYVELEQLLEKTFGCQIINTLTLLAFRNTIGIQIYGIPVYHIIIKAYRATKRRMEAENAFYLATRSVSLYDDDHYIEPSKLELPENNNIELLISSYDSTRTLPLPGKTHGQTYDEYYSRRCLVVQNSDNQQLLKKYTNPRTFLGSCAMN